MNDLLKPYAHNIRGVIKRELKLKGYDTKDLSVQVFSKILGVSKTYAWDILNRDDFNPQLSSLIKIATALEITVFDLLGG